MGKKGALGDPVKQLEKGLAPAASVNLSEYASNSAYFRCLQRPAWAIQRPCIAHSTCKACRGCYRHQVIERLIPAPWRQVRANRNWYFKAVVQGAKAVRWAPRSPPVVGHDRLQTQARKPGCSWRDRRRISAWAGGHDRIGENNVPDQQGDRQSSSRPPPMGWCGHPQHW